MLVAIITTTDCFLIILLVVNMIMIYNNGILRRVHKRLVREDLRWQSLCLTINAEGQCLTYLKVKPYEKVLPLTESDGNFSRKPFALPSSYSNAIYCKKTSSSSLALHISTR